MLGGDTAVSKCIILW